MVEAKIRSVDIAFIHPGLSATVKVTAYDFVVFGGLSGELENISADSILDDNGESFYKIMVRISASLARYYTGHIVVTFVSVLTQIDIEMKTGPDQKTGLWGHRQCYLGERPFAGKGLKKPQETRSV